MKEDEKRKQRILQLLNSNGEGQNKNRKKIRTVHGFQPSKVHGAKFWLENATPTLQRKKEGALKGPMGGFIY